MTIKTKEEIFEAFKADFQALLEKYGAELEVSEETKGPACYRRQTLELYIPSKYDPEAGNYITECVSEDLGTFFDKDSL